MQPVNVELDTLGPWLLTWFFCLFLSVFFVLFKIKKKYRIDNVFFIAALYHLTLALVASAFPFPWYGNQTYAYRDQAWSAFASFFIPLISVFVLNPKTEIIRAIFAALAMIEIGMLMTLGWGMMLMPSFSLVLLAMIFPLAGSYLKIAIAATIAIVPGETGKMMLAAQGLYALWHWTKAKGINKQVFGILLGAFTILFFSFFSTISENLSEIERVIIWKRQLRWMIEMPDTPAWIYVKSWLVGHFPGSYIWIAQLLNDWQAPIFQSAHNDWFQILFETGIIGLLLALASFLFALKKVWNDRVIAPALISMSVGMMTYHPMRHGPTMIVMTLISFLVLKRIYGK